MHALPPVLVVDKPYGWTSHDIVAKVRGITGERTVGHAGTLDPLATGVVVVLIGRDATKQQDAYMAGAKEYIATVAFGVYSRSEDAEGPLTFHADAARKAADALASGTLLEIIARYTGTIQQKAPGHSAIQVGGKRLYEQARRGTLRDEDIPVREVTIDSIDVAQTSTGSMPLNENLIQQHIDALNELTTQLQNRALDRDAKNLATAERATHVEALETLLPTVTLTVWCQKGTYIRALARDIGAELCDHGFLSNLRRTRVGDCTIEQAVLVESLTAKR